MYQKAPNNDIHTILRPILTCGLEACSPTTKIESHKQAAGMRVLRMIRATTRINKMRNTQKRVTVNVTSILKLADKSKLRVYGHVQRMNNYR